MHGQMKLLLGLRAALCGALWRLLRSHKDWLVRFVRKLGRGWSPGNCLPSLVI